MPPRRMLPDLPGCMSQGETLEELAKMAQDACEGWIETEYQRGNPIPLSSYPEEHSGRFNLRIPRSLHRALAEGAARERVSLNQYAAMLLARGDSQHRVDRQIADLSAKLDNMSESTLQLNGRATQP